MAVQGTPVLIGCGHGTKSAAGQQAIRDLLDAVRLAMPGVEVREAYVDVHGPKLADVIADIPMVEQGLAAVVVPLLVAGGYHVYHDIAEAVASRPDVVAAPALGPDVRLTAIVLDRLGEAHVSPESTLVLAAAGSSDERAMADTEAAAEMLRGTWDGPVRVAYAAGRSPSVADAVRSAHNYGEDGTVAVASFLLAPGVFQARLEEAGADVVTSALAPHPKLVSIVVDRYSSFIHD
ncbi:sirohydrochlorin chelatase [Demequina lutea]|uniref:Sirohydrochlorin ferrochelatase n=1 Tax=Demequina lutea TaxID=431489 RepID=A0A7Y9ZAK2_9MICO|nr:CbiX/SirB N-terminal domain-containing protein [Demequina lutea]NYI41028.1 sirohydrochlorin ferrochelatase [Demequina lutea]